MPIGAVLAGAANVGGIVSAATSLLPGNGNQQPAPPGQQGTQGGIVGGLINKLLKKDDD